MQLLLGQASTFVVFVVGTAPPSTGPHLMGGLVGSVRSQLPPPPVSVAGGPALLSLLLLQPVYARPPKPQVTARARTIEIFFIVPPETE
jgi:hypothetical protein